MAERRPFVHKPAGPFRAGKLLSGDTVPGTGSGGGTHGGAIAIQYNFSTTTANSDPGDGNLRLDNATQNAATTIRADLLDSNSTDWTDVLDSLDDSTSTSKGQIRLVHETDLDKWLVFQVTAVAAPAGYRNITVSLIDSSTANPFADFDPIVLHFSRTGDKGNAGNMGVDGQHGGGLTFRYVFTDEITDTDPGNGQLLLNSGTQNASTRMNIDLLDANGTDITTLLDSLDDGTSVTSGHFRLVHETDDTKWLAFSFTTVNTNTGYRRLVITSVASSTANPFIDGNPLIITFTLLGDKGDTGTAGTNGLHGGAVTIEYVIDTAIEVPDNGEITFDVTDQSTIAFVYFDLLDRFGENWESVFSTFTGGTSAIKAQVRIVQISDPTRWIVAELSSIPPTPIGQSYIPATVASVITSDGASTFADGAIVLATFTKVGDEGDVGATGAASNYDIQIFAGDGTWTKPTGASSVWAYLVGGGGGGGSGRCGTDGSAKGGGGGGGGGGYTTANFSAASLTGTEAVVVGAGGAGGASQSTTDTNGNAGSAGTATTFDSASAGGGGAGGAGTSAVGGAGGAAGDGTTVDGGAGGTGGFPGTANGVQGGSPSSFNAGAGGGGGGGQNGATVAISANGGTAGGVGGVRGLESTATTDTGGVVAAFPGNPGNVGPMFAFNNVAHFMGGGGGGGGGATPNGSANATVYGFGGAGGRFGAGGGGGASTINGVSSFNAGGTGHVGVAIIITLVVT